LKPKYYPHITILGAATIITAPLVLVLSLTHFRDNAEFDVAMREDSPIARPSHPTYSTQQDLNTALASLDQQHTAENASGQTRVAMRNDAGSMPQTLADRPSDAATSSAPSLPKPAFHTPHASEILNQIQAGTVDVVETRPVIAEEAVPVPSDIAPESVSVPAPTPVAQLPVAKPDQAIAQSPPKIDPERETLDKEMDVILAQKTTNSGPSPFDSTGHLSMASPRHAAIAGTPAMDSDEPANPRSNRRSTKSSRTNRKQTATADSVDGGSGAWPVDDDGFGQPAAVVLEDIILQQPLESRRVDRVEPVVAVTRAKGWPIALVRSDLPDDHWWVQQMVGTRGNAFAARVNFGNEESLPGSVYHLVIVFLDSPDEVRRFRIAKRFKELPEGTRRTREFTFVRR